MSDEPTAPDETDSLESPPDMPTDDTEPADEQREHSDGDTIDLVRYARYALLAGLTLVALVATFRFYFAVSNTIDTWVAREYRSLFQAAFNLVVLLVAAIAISWEVRKVAG
jgi:hypothetical protein